MKSKTGATKKRKKRDFSLPPPPGVRGSVRGGKSIATLAKILLDPSRSVLIVTGAGLSVASGIPTFRGSADSIWSSTLWTNATRGAFLKDPLRWWNDFWLEYFPLHYDGYEANEGHQSLAKILAHSENSYIITQNVDGLQQRVSNPSVDWSDRLIQAHGMIGLYKCVNDGDKDFQAFSFSNKKPSTAEGGDDPDDKDCAHNVNEEGNDDNTPGVEDCSDKKDDKNDKTDNENLSTNVCTYAYEKSLTANELLPSKVRQVMLCDNDEGLEKITVKKTNPKILKSNRVEAKSTLVEEIHLPPELPSVPICPGCNEPSILPQALMFDEGYDGHTFYQFDRIQKLLSGADCLIFVGTSLAVTLTDMAMKEARRRKVDVFNFNLEEGRIQPNNQLNVENVIGKAEETLPRLWEEVKNVVNR